MATLPEYTIGALAWQPASQGTTDQLAAYLVDLASYSAWRFNPSAVVPGTTTNVRYADGVVVDNMDGVADVYTQIGQVITKVPRYQKCVIPIPKGATTVAITGAGTPRVYFYTGTFHGQTDNVSFYSVQQMAAQSTITSGNIDAYLQTLRWKFNYQLAAGANLDNLTDSGFYDVLNPTSPASGNLPAGTWSITATTYSQSNLATYQLARNILSPDTQVYERRQTIANGWTPWRNVGLPVTGQCQFQYVSAIQCKLVPYGGGALTINGNVEQVPSAGVTVANMIGAATLTASTLYYAYAFMLAGAMTLEWSATAFALDARGCPVKAGDPSRTCVSAAYTDSAGKFVDTITARWVATYFNRVRRGISIIQDAASTGSTTPVVALGASVFSWGTDIATFLLTGETTNSQNTTCYSAVGVDGTKGHDQYAYISTQSGWVPVANKGAVSGLGMHTVDGRIWVAAGTGYWQVELSGEVLQ